MDTRWLKRRRQTWCARVRVPPALQSEVGQSEIARSLHTQDLREAQLKRHAVVAEIKQWLDSIRKGQQSPAEKIVCVAKETRKQMEERPESNAEEGFDIWVERFYDKPELGPATLEKGLYIKVIAKDRSKRGPRLVAVNPAYGYKGSPSAKWKDSMIRAWYQLGHMERNTQTITAKKEAA